MEIQVSKKSLENLTQNKYNAFIIKRYEFCYQNSISLLKFSSFDLYKDQPATIRHIYLCGSCLIQLDNCKP